MQEYTARNPSMTVYFCFQPSREKDTSVPVLFATVEDGPVVAREDPGGSFPYMQSICFHPSHDKLHSVTLPTPEVNMETGMRRVDDHEAAHGGCHNQVVFLGESPHALEEMLAKVLKAPSSTVLFEDGQTS